MLFSPVVTAGAVQFTLPRCNMTRCGCGITVDLVLDRFVPVVVHGCLPHVPRFRLPVTLFHVGCCGYYVPHDFTCRCHTTRSRYRLLPRTRLLRVTTLICVVVVVGCPVITWLRLIAWAVTLHLQPVAAGRLRLLLPVGDSPVTPRYPIARFTPR